MFIYVKLTIETGIFVNLFGVNTSIINDLLHKNFYSSDIERKCKNFLFINETAAILKGLGTKWYKCPNGHFYVVSRMWTPNGAKCLSGMQGENWRTAPCT